MLCRVGWLTLIRSIAGQQCDRNNAQNITAMKSAAEKSSSIHSAILRIREIVDGDIDPVITLLTRGFPNPRHYWEVGFARLQTRSLPPNIPRYGYLLEADNNPVGVILLISSLRRIRNREELFSNLSSWYVEPDYRSHAAQLFKRALANEKTTFLNVSAATHVRPFIEAFGFKRYSEGQVLAALALARDQEKGAHIVEVDHVSGFELEESERLLLKAQASYGCITFCCATNHQTRPFVFVPRFIKGFIPCAQLAYCRKMIDLVEVAGSVGRYLVRHGWPFVLLDANGPVPGIPGKYFADVAPKYYRGAATPVLGDLAETEATIFGFGSRRR